MPQEIADEARQTHRDRFGHELQVSKAKAPCRVCLRISKAPEDMILLSHQPLADTGPYAEIGPVFIHSDACEAYAEYKTFPADFTSRRLILRAYGHGGQIVDASVAEPGEASEVASAFLRNDQVAEVHVRHESYTCYDFKIVR